MPVKKTTIVAADDAPQLLRLMMRNLQFEGYEVIPASNGQQALEEIEEQAPELVLREGAGVPTNLHPEGLRPVRVMLALDGSKLSEAALTPAAQLSAALSAPAQGELHLVQVIHFPESAGGSQSRDEALARQQVMAEAKAYLKTVKERLLADGQAALNLHVTTFVMADMDVAHALINVAELGTGLEVEQWFLGYDVIAMATHGRSGPQSWMLGSVTERVLGGTKLPLLIVRPRKMEAQAEDAGAVLAGVVSSTGL